jgi:hypothetical protein
VKQTKLYAGETIKGFVIVLIDDDGGAPPVTSVGVEFRGSEETVWFDGVKQDQRHGASRSLGSQQTLLWSAGEDDEHAALDVGTHTFPFELSTNATLPSSYEDSGANVSLFSGGGHDLLPKSFGGKDQQIK